jgi:predicted ATPase
MDAAEAVLDDAGAPEGFVLDAVARLVERSMVIADPGAPTRYRMLETLRQYAAEQLRDSGDLASVAAHHARHFHDLVVAAELDLRGPRQRDALLLLRREQPNVRAALNWLSGPDGDLDQALEMAGSLGISAVTSRAGRSCNGCWPSEAASRHALMRYRPSRSSNAPVAV